MSRIIGRVVVGVSGSPENLHALRHAVELARHYDATLIAVNARPAPGRGHRGPGPRRRGRSGPVWQQAASLVVRAAFEDALGGLPSDIECILLAAPGDPGPALVAVADRANDVLVLGSAQRRGTLRPTRVARSSVVAYCIARGACSVLTVPPPPLATVARGRARV